MKYKTYFRSIDEICNHTNQTYQQAIDTVYKKLVKENTIYGIKPIYVKELNKYYLELGKNGTS